MVKEFNEDTRVKIPGVIQFLRLGYDYQSFREANLEGTIDPDTNIFKKRLKISLERINNKKFTNNDIEDILFEISKTIKYNDLGKTFYRWLINPENKIKLIDFNNIYNNDFAVVCELPFKDYQFDDSFRPDITILINGIPLSFLEVKKPNNPGGIRKEFNRMKYRFSKNYFDKFFNMLQILSFSNNMEYEEVDNVDNIRAGSFYTTPNKDKTTYSFLREDDEKYYYNYNFIDIPEDIIAEITRDCGYGAENCYTPEFQTNLKTTTPCNEFITSLYDKERLLYFIKYGITYVDKQILEKHIMRYPQFFASKKIIDRLDSGEKSGIIWHTQGSGKTALAAFTCRVLKEYYSYKNINTRFYFIVDRLDLLTQAEIEFKERDFNVITCNNRQDFQKELNKQLSTKQLPNTIGEICVVNIHKFIEDMPKSKNDYDVKVQRVFFIDEAHRSYSSTGSFFKNLLSADTDAVYLALTGTPILTKKERTNLKFGDYIHKYFYDKSIADGYTLRIKKEKIDTEVKAKLRNELKIVDDDSEIDYESKEYISCLGEFIEEDFLKFRQPPHDNNVGAMVVCRTNLQAEKMYNWFLENSKLKTGLVMSKDGEQETINKKNQYAFKDKSEEEVILDLLVVNRMLTTGYDVDRLKKLYLLRGPKAHTLLQTLARVNRPYTSPNGYVYKYGYVVDFVDIETEYDKTLNDYIQELQSNIEEDEKQDLDEVVVDNEYVYNEYLKSKAELDKYHLNTENAEVFRQQIEPYTKEALIKIKKNLNDMTDAYMELLISREDKYLKNINFENIKNLSKCVKDRISFLNIKEDPVDKIIKSSEEEIKTIFYEFKKVKTELLELGASSEIDNKFDKLTNILLAIRTELKKNSNKKDKQIIILNEWMEGLFEKLENSDLEDIDTIINEAIEVLEEIKKINKNNTNFLSKYDNNPAYLKTYTFITKNYNLEPDIIEYVLDIIYEDINKINTSVLINRGRKNFIDKINKDTTLKLYEKGIFDIIKKCYEPILNEFYNNLRAYDEGLNA